MLFLNFHVKVALTHINSIGYSWTKKLLLQVIQLLSSRQAYCNLCVSFNAFQRTKGRKASGLYKIISQIKLSIQQYITYQI